MLQRVEKLADIHLEDPSPLPRRTPLPQRLQGLVRRPSGPEAVRTRQKVVLKNRLQEHHHGPLEHFVFQRRNAQRTSFPARPFRNVNPSHRRCPVPARLGLLQQSLEVALQIPLVVGRRLAIDARRRILARAVVRLP